MRGLARSAAGVLAFALVFVSLVALVVRIEPPRHERAALDCPAMFARALEDGNAAGLWACISPDMRLTYFRSNGWAGEADMQRWLDGLRKVGARYGVQSYAGNPVQLCATNPQGATVCRRGWVLFVRVYLRADPDPADPRSVPRYSLDSQDSSSVTLVLSDRGLIDALV